MRTVYVDPGLNACGLCLTSAGVLLKVGFVTNPTPADAPMTERIEGMVQAVTGDKTWRAQHVVAEHPQAPPGAKGKRRRDTSNAAAVAEGIVAHYKQRSLVPSTIWAGQAKAARHVAALDVLTGDELLALRLAGMDVGGYLAALEDGRTPSPWHDVIDAVALGLWHQGRASW